MYLNRHASPLIKTVFPEYHNYIARDFCAISRLIRTKLESKHFDVYEVKEWLGHTQIQTTMTYIKDTKDYFKLAPFDWINHTLRAKSEESAKKSIKPKKRLIASNLSC
jgi:integrase